MSGGASGSAAAPATGGSVGQTALPLALTFTPTQALCPGQAYEIALTAQGGVGPYTWSLAADTTGATLSSVTGMSVTLDGAADKSQPTVSVSVKDATGAAQTKDIALNVMSVADGSCVQVTPATLPPPCIDNPYVVPDPSAISKQGGSAPYTWKAISIPEGLQFDTTTQTLSGTALASGANTPLTLSVTDSLGHQSQFTYALEYRDKCWLAFTQNADGDTRLRLYDPALQTYAGSVDGSPNNTGVVDFKFSPDGELVAYRRATSDRTQQLVLLNVPIWQEQVLAIPGSVLSYSWSPGARFLAVAYLDADGNTLLGGIDATNVDSTQSTVSLLNPIQVMDATHARLNSDLLWLHDNQLVAFHGDLAFDPLNPQDEPYFVGFSGTGFVGVTTPEYGYDLPVDLEPAVNGVFAIAHNPSQNFLDFWNYATNESDSFLNPPVQSAVADPEGRFVAFPLQGELELAFTAESGGTTDPPRSWNLSRGNTVDVGCDSILGFNPQTEQVVCDKQVGVSPDTTAEVRLFDLAPATKSAEKLTLAQLTGYHAGDAANRRRSFSAAGDLFAFTTRDAVFVSSSVSAQVEFSMPITPLVAKDQPGELAFSPDGSILLWQSGPELGVMALAKNGRQNWYDANNDLLPPQPCAEEFVSDPKAWCGRSTPSAVAWSSTSLFAAAMTAGHGLRAYDLSQFASAFVTTSSEACTADCNTDFVFQP